MFDINFATGEIRMNAGDTGSFEIAAERSDGEPWTEDDVATFTIQNAAGEDVLLRDYSLVGELGNGIIGIEFQNSDTDDLPAGTYSWEMRYAVNGLYDSVGELVTGDIVQTPGADGKGDPMTLIIKRVLRHF